MKPIIAITPQYDSADDTISIRRAYTDAVYRSGGIPIILQQIATEDYVSEICNFADGILFTGGNDIDPCYYGEKKDKRCGKIDVMRDEFEMMLCRKAAERDIPVLGICRGTQLINVCEGGKCIQHVESHMNCYHQIEIVRNSLLYSIVKSDRITVNSFHHQAVSNLPGHMKICAVSNGNIIEAIHKKDAFFNLSVQWHPERTYTADSASKMIFDAFVGASDYYKRLGGI